MTFIGTTEEFPNVEHLFSDKPNVILEKTTKAHPSAPQEQSVVTTPTKTAKTNFSVEDITRVLDRIRIPRGQRQLYKALYDAGEKGLFIAELASQMNRDDVPSILGALGNRVNHTEEVKRTGEKPGIEMLFEIQQRENTWHYIMKPELRKALEKLNPRPDWLDNMIP
jgi:hypothetical protein